ncbi:MAG: TonB-dependent receptor [Woeseiaceae bacterium]|jgi:vitamin B12 transporter
MRIFEPVLLVAVSLCLPLSVNGADGNLAAADAEIAEITVKARRVANTLPAGTFAAPTTVLRFDPQTELQSRGLPEGQADVTVRGGLFENTGFKAAAVTIMDPQTGHYVAELPIDPESLSLPELLTGVDNALAGFNSNIATVRYTLPLLRDGGSAILGVGDSDLKFGSLRWANVFRVSGGADIGLSISAALSEGDGTVDDGDHEFQRYNFHLQRSAERAQSDLILAYQDKFYGWPGAYTGFASLPETDDTQTTLLLANHRHETERGWWQVGAFYRRLVDDYDFDRRTQESGAPGSFDHETRVAGLGFEGMSRQGKLDWNYAGQFTADDLVRSTDLLNSEFTTRNYGTLSLVPSLEFYRDDGRSITIRFGGTVDVSNRDSDAVSPVLGATMSRSTEAGTRSLTIEYAGTSQLPGYTVLGSGPSGLFGGNSGLGREKAGQLLVALTQDAPDWRGSIAMFYRQDDNLVDWTFATESPFARQANAVDLDVFGIEALYSRAWDSLDLSVGYTYLDKDSDYGTANVDASFYALNFARHRATLAIRYRFGEGIEFSLDNEYRKQEDNPLRTTSGEAFVVSASLTWAPANGSGFGVAVTADNLTDDDYQQFPGTPAVGRQVSISARYRW